MRLKQLAPQNDWQSDVEENYLPYHSVNGGFWVDDKAIVISQGEMAAIDSAVRDLHLICMETIPFAIENGMLDMMGLPRETCEEISASWLRRDPWIRERFDLSVLSDENSVAVKAWECNADTPTTMPESGTAQAAWFERRRTDLPGFGHRNSLLADFASAFSFLPESAGRELVFVSDHRSIEDYSNCQFMRRAAEAAGFLCRHENLAEVTIGDGGVLFDSKNRQVRLADKLYPWEFLLEDTFNRWPSSEEGTVFLEPAWKMLPSSKLFWVFAWKKFRGHPNLLPTYLSPEEMSSDEISGGFAKKPIFSREGANCSIHDADGSVLHSTGGVYGAEGYVYQAKAMPAFVPGAGHVSCGAWAVNASGDGSVGRTSSMIMRVTESPICEDIMSMAYPHLVEAP